MCLLADIYRRVGYPTPDMASILKATSTVGARPLKPSSREAKKVRGKLKCLSKEHMLKGAVEKKAFRKDRSREAKGKEKTPDEP